MPGRIRHLHGELVGELALPVFREPGAGDRPGFRVSGAGDDADPDAARCAVRRRGGGVLGRRLRVLDGRGPQLLCRVHACFRRPGDKHARSEIDRQRRRQLQLVHLVVSPFKTNGIGRTQKTLNDCGVLEQPRITLVVGRRVIERIQIVLESPRHHVEVQAAAVEMRKRRDHLGHAVGVHVDWLDRHQRAQTLSGLDDQLRDQPGIQLRIVRKHENALAPCIFAPARDFLQLAQARPGLRQCGRRTHGKDLQTVIGGGRGHNCMLALNINKSVLNLIVGRRSPCASQKRQNLIHSAHGSDSAAKNWICALSTSRGAQREAASVA